jgi:O-antigen/teichoic acid export membrane protein
MGVKKIAVSGAKWTGVSKLVNTGLQLGQLAILGRILGTTDFGLMAMVMVVIGFAETYIDMGVSNALIQKQKATKRQLSTLYWINILSGLVLFIIFNISSPLIVSFYGEEQLSGLIFLASFIFLITPFGQQFYVLIQKQLKFKLLAKIDSFSLIIGVGTSIVLAMSGYGVYSLVWGHIINVFLKTLLSSLVGFKEFPPSLEFSFSEVKEFLKFGFYQMGEKTTNYFSKNIDYILIGKYFGPEILGAYTIAFQLIIVPVQKINPILNRVAFPLFSKFKDNNEVLRKGYLKLMELLTFVSYPVLIFLAFFAPLVIPVFFGSGWDLTITLIPIMVIIGLLRTLGNPVGSLYLAKGRPDIGFYFNISIAFINLISFWIAAQYSVYHVAWVLFNSEFILFPCAQINCRQIIRIKLAAFYPETLEKYYDSNHKCYSNLYISKKPSFNRVMGIRICNYSNGSYFFISSI